MLVNSYDLSGGKVRLDPPDLGHEDWGLLSTRRLSFQGNNKKESKQKDAVWNRRRNEKE